MYPINKQCEFRVCMHPIVMMFFLLLLNPREYNFDV